jgi:hypothetical protein
VRDVDVRMEAYVIVIQLLLLKIERVQKAKKAGSFQKQKKNATLQP